MRNTYAVQGVFGTVVWVVAGVGVLVALIAALAGRKTWDEYGRQHLVLDTDSSVAKAGGSNERDEEIRQMLEARNARRRRRGQPEVDVEQELARLSEPQIDAELRQEIRDLVIARNHRRARRGEPPLDVEAEIAREIESLRGL